VRGNCPSSVLTLKNCLLKDWANLSTCIKWLVPRGFANSRALIESQECVLASLCWPPSAASVPCGLRAPSWGGSVQSRGQYSALEKPACLSTLWQREVLKCIFEDVWTDLFERHGSYEVILVSPHVSLLKAGCACRPLTANVLLFLLEFDKTLLKTWGWQKSTQRGAYNCYRRGSHETCHGAEPVQLGILPA
jgi:hypothetical protein